MAELRDEAIRVVMVPWLAFGHFIPFFQLSIALAKSGVHVYFLSTPKNIQRLPKIPSNLSAFIHLVPLPLPKLDPGLLPEDAEATVDIPGDKIQYLKIAYDLLQEPVKKFIEVNLPHWIIVDFAPYWAVDIAMDLNIPVIIYYVMTSATAVFFGPPAYLVGEGQRKARSSPESLTVAPEWINFPSKVAYRNYEAIGMHAGLYGQNASGITDVERIANILQMTKAAVVRTCHEFEADYLKSQVKITGKPVFPLGFLPPEQQSEDSTVITSEPWSTIFKWLDDQKPKSVVFVGFGSETKLSKEQIHEIAYGVELSGLTFLWALRKPDWSSSDLDIVPPGFSSSTAGRGVVHVGWAPQREILAHPSVGGSLFHAGWGSIIETLQYGHSLVFLPFIIDQPLNARLLEEKGLGIEVKRGEDGSFRREDIANSLITAMISEEGEEMRARAREAAAIFGDQKLHDHYIRVFVDYLKNGAEQNGKEQKE